MSRRQLAAVIYAGGHPMRQVALVMGVTFHAASSLVKAVRDDYRRRGVDASDVVKLGRALRADGLLRD